MKVAQYLNEALTFEIAKKCWVAIAALQGQGVVLVTNADLPADRVKIAILTLQNTIDTIYKSYHIFRFE